jgi:hypothetical protein
MDGVSLEQKLDVIKETLIGGLPRHKHAIRDFISDVVACRKERHAIIHHVWMKTDSDDIKGLMDYRVWKEIEPAIRVTPKTMMSLATRMIDLSFEFSDWRSFLEASHLNPHPALRGIFLPRESLQSPPRRSLRDYAENLR